MISARSAHANTIKYRNLALNLDNDSLVSDLFTIRINHLIKKTIREGLCTCKYSIPTSVEHISTFNQGSVLEQITNKYKDLGYKVDLSSLNYFIDISWEDEEKTMKTDAPSTYPYHIISAGSANRMTYAHCDLFTDKPENMAFEILITLLAHKIREKIRDGVYSTHIYVSDQNNVPDYDYKIVSKRISRIMCDAGYSVVIDRRFVYVDWSLCDKTFPHSGCVIS